MEKGQNTTMNGEPEGTPLTTGALKSRAVRPVPFRRVHPMTEDEILNEIVPEMTRRIVAVAKPRRVILFGSAARGQMGPDSDVDVLVVIPDGIGRRMTTEAIYLALYGLGISKDILVVTEGDLAEHGENPSMVYAQALQEGKELYRAQA